MSTPTLRTPRAVRLGPVAAAVLRTTGTSIAFAGSAAAEKSKATRFTSESVERRGRPRGSESRVKKDHRIRVRELLESPAYLKAQYARIIAGQAPSLEIVLHYYAYGKPKSDLPLAMPVVPPIAEMMRLMSPDDILKVYEISKRLRTAAADRVIDVSALAIAASSESG